MLALFTLGMTPRIAVHALVARHTDRHLVPGHLKVDLLTRAGFFCRVDSLVVELPCLYCPAGVLLPAPRVYRVGYSMRADDQYYSFEHYLFGLRGPPRTV